LRAVIAPIALRSRLNAAVFSNPSRKVNALPQRDQFLLEGAA
jgi:hypothetical protein